MEKCQEETLLKELKDCVEEDEVRQVEKDVMKAVLSVDVDNSIVSGDFASTVDKRCDVERSSTERFGWEPCQLAGQHWDCSQVWRMSWRRGMRWTGLWMTK